MNSKIWGGLALGASVAYGLILAFVKVSMVMAVIGAFLVAALWMATATARRSEVSPRDRSARTARRNNRL